MNVIYQVTDIGVALGYQVGILYVPGTMYSGESIFNIGVNRFVFGAEHVVKTHILH